MNIYIAKHKMKELLDSGMSWPSIAKELGLTDLSLRVKILRGMGMTLKEIADRIPMPLSEVKKLIVPEKVEKSGGRKMTEESKMKCRVGFCKYVDSGRIQQQPGRGKYKGLSKRKGQQRWRVNITVNGKSKYLGTYSNEIEAAMAYNDGVDKYCNGVGYKNIIEQDYSI